MKTILKIKNFKSLEDVEIELKPKMFFLGPNGSGKSSFLKLLLFIKQNIFNDSSNLNRDIKYKLSDEVDLGSFKDMISKNDINREICFSFEVKIEASEIGQIGDKSSTFDFINSKLIKGDFDTKLNSLIELYKKQNYFEVFNFLMENKDFIEYFFREINKEFNLLFEFKLIKDNTSNGIFLEYKIVDLDTDSFIQNYLDQSGKHDFIASEANIENGSVSVHFKNPRINIFNGLSSIISAGDFKQYVGPENFLIDFSEEIQSKFFKYIDLYKNALDEHSNELLNSQLKEDVVDFDYDENEENYSPNRNQKTSHRKILDGMFQLYKFVYLFPTILKQHFNVEHLSGIRKIPNHNYFLTNDKFPDKEYYGLLNLFRDKYFISLLSEVIKINKTNSQDSINDDVLFERFKQIEEIKQLSYEDQQKIFLPILMNILKTKEEWQGQYWYYCLKHLQNMNLCKAIYYIKDQNNVYGSIRIATLNDTEINLAEASSGLLQILPIVLYINSSDSINNSCLMIEQPELHLHPKLQAGLSEVLIETVKPLIVETHSEHIIRKIQVLVAEGKINEENLAFYYFDSNQESRTTAVKVMEMNEMGLFKGTWPNGFFDEASDLAYALLDAQINRKN